MSTRGGRDSPAGRRFLHPEVAGYLACAAALVLAGAVVFRYPLLHGITNICNIDGLTQHFPALWDFHRVTRAFLADPSAGVPQWSWHLGLGANRFGALSYYVGDPFALLALPFPSTALEIAYQALYFLRLFVAGMLAYAYLRTMRVERLVATGGALGYVFVTFSLFSALRHPYFANAMVYLPLLLIGIERLYAGCRPHLFVFAVFLAAVSNFYFFYQLSIVLWLYAVARWVESTPGPRRRDGAWSAFTKVVVPYVIGIALAGVLLVPAVAAFLASSRSGVRQPVGLLHGLASYGSYVRALVTSYRGTKSVFGGFPIIGLLLVPVLYMRRGRHTALKVMIAAFAVFLAFPVFGTVFNGFAFPSYRFLFMWGLFLMAGAGVVLSGPRAFTRPEIAAAATWLGVFTVMLLVASRSVGYKIVGAPLIGAALILLMAFESWWSDRRGTGRLPVVRVAMVALVFVNVAWMGITSLDPRYATRLDGYFRRGEVSRLYRTNPGALAARLPGKGFFRVDKQEFVHGTNLGTTSGNDALVQGYHGLEFYYSILDGHLFRYLESVDDRSMRMSFDYEGFDDRAVLDTLNGVRYHLASRDATGYAPYGFEEIAREGETVVYENRYALPLGYVHHAAISEERYAAMRPLDRQQAMLQGVVLRDGDAPSLQRTAPTSEVVAVPFKASGTRGAEVDLEAGTLRVSRQGAGVDLSFGPVPDAELYVEITGMDFSPKRPALRPATGLWSLLRREAEGSRFEETIETDPVFIEYAAAGRPPKTERLEPVTHPYHWGDDSQLVNLGHFADGTGSASLRVGSAGTLRFQRIRVWAIPMGDHARRVAALADEGLTGVRIGDDMLTATVASRAPGVLFLSVPYDTGWTAQLDGEPADVLVADLGFCGIAVGEGTHRIEMRYRSPGMATGAWVSLAGLLSFAAIAAVDVLRRRAERPPATASPPAGR